MQQLFCQYPNCNKSLDEAGEIVTGLCGRHFEQLRSDVTYVGVCWQCGNITLIQSKKENRKFPIKDKYIFARGCQNCTSDLHEGIMWMTIKNDSQPVSAVTPTGKIVPIKEKTMQENR